MKDAEIRERLKQMASDVGPDSTMLAQVKSVNEAGTLCDLYDDENGLDFFDVRLRPVLDGKESLTIIPKVHSWVLAVRLEDSDDWMIVTVGEAEKYLLKCDNIVVNGGQNGGLLNWPSAKVQADLIKQFIHAVKQVCSTPVAEPGNGALSAFQAALNGAISAIQTPDFEGLEDTKFKH